MDLSSLHFGFAHYQFKGYQDENLTKLLTNSTNPGLTARMCRLACHFTGGKL
jgi:hypothetical protein